LADGLLEASGAFELLVVELLMADRDALPNRCDYCRFAVADELAVAKLLDQDVVIELDALHRHLVRHGTSLTDPGLELLHGVEVVLDLLDAVLGEDVGLEALAVGGELQRPLPQRRTAAG